MSRHHEKLYCRLEFFVLENIFDIARKPEWKNFCKIYDGYNNYITIELFLRSYFL